MARSQLRGEVTTSWRGHNFVIRSQLRGEVTTSWRGHNFLARTQLCSEVTTLWPWRTIPKGHKEKEILNMSYIYNIGVIKKWEMVSINFRNSGWIQMDSSKKFVLTIRFLFWYSLIWGIIRECFVFSQIVKINWTN